MSPKSLIEGIAEDAVAPIGQVGGELLVKAALLLVALAGVGVGAAFLTSALYIVAVDRLGRIEALLVVGGIYLVVATAFAAFVFVHGRVGAPGAKRAIAPQSDPRRKSESAEGMTQPTTERLSLASAGSRESAEAREPGIEHVLDRLTTPMLDLLHEQGMERERLALAAGLTVAKELRPWMLVGLMVALGAVMGHFSRHQDSSGRPVGVRPR